MDYRSDDSIYTPGILTFAQSFVAGGKDSYQTSAPEFLDSATATGDACGAAILENTTGTRKLFLATPTAIQQANGSGGWTARSGTTYGTGTGGYASFAQFGDFHLFGNGAQLVQACTSGNFADIATSPRAKILMVHENGVIALNISGSPAGWARSDTGDHTTWTATAANDADSGILYGGRGGGITAGAVWQNLAVAWKSGAMYGGIFIGDIDEKLRWQFIDPNVGCVGPNAWVETEVGIIFVSKRDVLLFDGTKPRSITDGLRRSLFAAMRFQRDRVVLTHDEAEKCVYIWFSEVAGANPTVGYSYNYKYSKWGGVVFAIDSSTMGNLRCPVRNVTYDDYQAIGGFGTSSFGQANVAMLNNTANTGCVVANYAHQPSPATRLHTPILNTGLLGNPFTDSVPGRLYVIQDDIALTKTDPSQIQVQRYDSQGNAEGSIVSASINEDGHGDFQGASRFILGNVTWGLATGQIGVRELTTNPKQAGSR